MAVPVVTLSEMRAWEKASWAAGATESQVIARVGERIAETIRSQILPGQRVLLLAGRGNNGADARATEPHLADYQSELLVVTDPEAALPALRAALSRRPALLVDGLFGIGLNRPLDPAWSKFLQTINEPRLTVLAVDVPSGLNADSGDAWGTVVRAELTLTVGAPKIGLLAPSALEWVGRLEVADRVGLVGEPSAVSELRWILPEDVLTPARRRPVASHKGSFGHAVIIAGSVGYAGAAVLAARAASRARPGLVSVLTAPDSWLPVSSQLAAAMVHPLTPRHPVLAQATAILAGPGLAAPNLPPEVRAEVIQLWREFPGTMVVDASALDWLRPGTPCVGPRVVTPHPGEAGRLLGISSVEIQSERLGSLRRIAQRHEALVVLKGHQTLIGGATGPVFINPVGNPGLAQGGTGDVLAGFMTGLLAQPDGRTDLVGTCCRATWQHGWIADRLEQSRSGWTAEDLAAALHS